MKIAIKIYFYLWDNAICFKSDGIFKLYGLYNFND